MMADAIEAASRSLKEYNEESISALVGRIIDTQQAEGCFTECPLTFKDLSDAKRVFIDSLKTIYHTRIAYPEMNKPTLRVNVGTEAEQSSGQRKKHLFSSNTWTWKR